TLKIRYCRYDPISQFSNHCFLRGTSTPYRVPETIRTLKFNTNLSEARAKAVVEYFSSHGIAKERLVYRGYAFSQPIAPNNTPDGRQMNRRVEFKILGKE
ncbi:MAG TPA: OmpA family protein, partial [Bacteroidales bacterium]|nr:OmpA family protein [Bacteroidales bacterium]